MVSLNTLRRADGNSQVQTRRPRKFLFNLGSYDVSAIAYETGFILSIWDAKQVIGTINLTSYFHDVASIFTIDTKITEDYQGIGIAYRSYEGLLLHANIALATSNQSLGAVKLWRRFATHRSMAIYFVVLNQNSYEVRLFDSLIHPVELRGGQLYAIVNHTRVDPYQEAGALLLVHRNRPLDRAIQQHIVLQTQRASLHRRFKRQDRHTLVGGKAQ